MGGCSPRKIVQIIKFNLFYMSSFYSFSLKEDCCCSLAESCLTFCDPVSCCMPRFPVLHHFPEFAQIHIHWVGIQPSHPLMPPFLLPSIFPSIRVFPSESVLHISWPNCWSFSFSISSSNEYPELISFRMDWLDLLAVQGILKSPPAPQFKSIDCLELSFFLWPNSHIHTWLL